MNIITKNMPNNCIECSYRGFCLLPSNETEKYLNARHEKCPMIKKIEVNDIEKAFQELDVAFENMNKAMLQVKNILEQLNKFKKENYNEQY